MRTFSTIFKSDSIRMLDWRNININRNSSEFGAKRVLGGTVPAVADFTELHGMDGLRSCQLDLYFDRHDSLFEYFFHRNPLRI